MWVLTGDFAVLKEWLPERVFSVTLVGWLSVILHNRVFQ